MIELEVLPFVVKNTSRPFHGCYPFKVKIANPFKHNYPTKGWDGHEKLTTYVSRVRRQCAAYHDAVDIFLQPFVEFIVCRQIEAECYHVGTPSFQTFYFEQDTDFNAFIAVFRDEIVEVVRPSEAFDAALLDTPHDIKRSFRDSLYFGSFAWKVLFAKDCDGESLDDWVDHCFAGDTSRFHYDASNKQRSLYLTSECDVALTKMSQAPSIYDIEQII